MSRFCRLLQHYFLLLSSYYTPPYPNRVLGDCLLSGMSQDENAERVHRYVRNNADLAWKAVTAVERGDAEGLGRVMAQAQVSLRVETRNTRLFVPFSIPRLPRFYLSALRLRLVFVVFLSDPLVVVTIPSCPCSRHQGGRGPGGPGGGEAVVREYPQEEVDPHPVSVEDKHALCAFVFFSLPGTFTSHFCQEAQKREQNVCTPACSEPPAAPPAHWGTTNLSGVLCPADKFEHRNLAPPRNPSSV